MHVEEILAASRARPIALAAVPDILALMDRLPRLRPIEAWSWLGVVGRVPAAADRALDQAQARGFRFLWAILPEPEIARDPRFQHILFSRFLSNAGQEALAFGALIAVARDNGSALELALIGVAALAPATLLGMYGGAVADELPKKLALAGAYSAQALLCFLVPSLLGTSLPVVLVLIFLVNTIGQISSPAESSVLPLVASDEHLASGVSLINLAGGAGSGFGMAVLAPVIVRTTGLEVVFYVAGALLLLAASRVFDLPVGDRAWRGRLMPIELRVRPAFSWIMQRPAVAMIIIVAALAGTVNHVLVTLAPRYVEEVLRTDAANTAFVLLPSSAGVVLGLVAAPTIMRLRGERVAALLGLVVGATFLTLLGLVNNIDAVIEPWNPLRILGLFGVSTGGPLRTASILSLPLSFGVSLAAASAQTYINRRVPLRFQGRTFAMQSSLRSGAAMVALVTLGAAASRFGADRVLLATPVVLAVLGFVLIEVSFRFASRAPPAYLEVLSSFWEAPGEPGHREADNAG